jgi:hypothetical protein
VCRSRRLSAHVHRRAGATTSIMNGDGSHHAREKPSSSVVRMLRVKQCRSCFQLVSSAHLVCATSGRSTPRSSARYSPFIREFALSSTLAQRGSGFIRDVDHHARACWWSTSESSEKCPRVTRGNMSVPSDFAFSLDLTGICVEFVGALSRCVNCEVFHSEVVSEARRIVLTGTVQRATKCSMRVYARTIARPPRTL